MSFMSSTPKKNTFKNGSAKYGSPKMYQILTGTASINDTPTVDKKSITQSDVTSDVVVPPFSSCLSLSPYHHHLK